MTITVAALCAASPMAMSLQHAGSLMQIELPGTMPEARGGPAGQQAGPPERFVIARGVAVVPVRGVLTPDNALLEYYLGWTTYAGLVETMGELAANADVSAVVIEGNSPGGFVIGIQAAAQAIAAVAAVKPVHALVNPLAASAAYWLVSQAREVTMTPGAVVGSIGVAVTSPSAQVPDTRGDRWFTLTSSHARAKLPDPGTDEGRAELQRHLDETEAEFHAAVSAGRKIAAGDLAARLSVTDDPRDGGATFGPARAQAIGLADRMETRADFYARVFGAYAPKPRSVASRAFAAQAAAAAAQARL